MYVNEDFRMGWISFDKGPCVINTTASYMGGTRFDSSTRSFPSQVITNRHLSVEDYCLLGCCAVLSGNSLLIFQSCLLPPSSGR
jgi:hypothetical protein